MVVRDLWNYKMNPNNQMASKMIMINPRIHAMPSFDVIRFRIMFTFKEMASWGHVSKQQ